MQIDGVETLYGAVEILEIWRIGDPGRFIGESGLTVGGQVRIEPQETLISWSAGTSNTINQVLNPDKGTNESVTTLKVGLIDKSLKATKLVTPGEFVPDVLGRRVKIWLGEAESSWKDDYNIIFRGIIDEVDAKSGAVTISLAQGGNINRASFLPAETELDGAISDSDTTITVLSTADFLTDATGPAADTTNIKHYIRIDDELIEYTGVTATTFTGCIRGRLQTAFVAHTDGQQVQSFYRLTGNAVDIALKFMLSGPDDPYLEDVSVTSFNTITPSLNVPNAIFLSDFDIKREFNLQIGDFVTTSGAINGANDFTDRVITDIVLSEVGYYVVVDGAALVDEGGSTAVISFKSQWNAWGEGAGLNLKPEEVDIEAHIDVKQKFLSSAEYDFYIKEEIEDGKEFLSEQVYNPVSAYSVPRKAQASIAYNVGPIPGVRIKTLDTSNTLNAPNISTKRGTNRRFFNTIVYKFDEEVLEERFTRGTVFIDSDSLDRIPTGNKPLTIESKGLREILSGINTAQIASARRLNRYKFAAEQSKLKVNFEAGFDVEIADKIIINFSDLQITDINTGTRSGDNRIYEITNKTLNIKTGEVELEVLNTNTDLNSRFALIAPASRIKSGTDGKTFLIEPTFNTVRFGASEWKKWERLTGTEVIVRSEDFSVSAVAILEKVTSNTITLETDLGFTPLAGYFMEPSNYSDQTSDAKLVYASMSDGDNDFADGGVSYKMS